MRILVAVLLALALVGCSQPAAQAPPPTCPPCPTCPAPVAQVVEQTVVVKETVVVEVTRVVEVQATPMPTTPAVAADSDYPPGQLRHEGIDMQQERGGVTILVKDVIITPMTQEWAAWVEAHSRGNIMAASLAQTALDSGAVALVNLSIEVNNTTGKTISIYPDQGTLVVGNEQVDADLWLSDSVGGDFMAGIMKEGGVVFLVMRTESDAISHVRYMVDAPSENFDRLADTGYDFDIALP